MTCDLIVLTDQRYLKDSSDPYKHNVFYEDELVLKASQKLGLQVTRRAWDDDTVDWSQTKCILFRSTWDYFDRFIEFSGWLNKVKTQTKLINSRELIHWNIDKHYLNDLSAKGVHIPDTIFIKKGDTRTLSEIHLDQKWNKTVLKPCVSGAGRHTYLLDIDNLVNHEDLYQTLISEEDMMIQVFQQNIMDQGEFSLMLFNGEFTHAVLKKAKPGDFRVQDDFGGTVHEYTPSLEEIKFAQNAVAQCPEIPIYARVDIFYDNNDTLALGELELIEPELWFRIMPSAAEVLAKHLKNLIDET